MKTTIDLVNDLYTSLNTGAVAAILNTGEVFKFKKPDGYTGKCIVVNSLGTTGAQLQRGIVNVNVHAPNLQLTIAGQPDNSQPDTETIQGISAVVIPIVKNLVVNNSLAQVENISLISDEETREHFLNIRLLMNSINI